MFSPPPRHSFIILPAQQQQQGGTTLPVRATPMDHGIAPCYLEAQPRSVPRSTQGITEVWEYIVCTRVSLPACQLGARGVGGHRHTAAAQQAALCHKPGTRRATTVCTSAQATIDFGDNAIRSASVAPPRRAHPYSDGSHQRVADLLHQAQADALNPPEPTPSPYVIDRKGADLDAAGDNERRPSGSGNVDPYHIYN